MCMVHFRTPGLLTCTLNFACYRLLLLATAYIVYSLTPPLLACMHAHTLSPACLLLPACTLACLPAC